MTTKISTNVAYYMSYDPIRVFCEKNKQTDKQNLQVKFYSNLNFSPAGKSRPLWQPVAMAHGICFTQTLS